MTAVASPRLGVLLSGGGRTLQNLLDRELRGELQGHVVGVGSDRKSAGGLARAQRAGLPTVVSRDCHVLYDFMDEHRVDLLLLGGYLRLLPIQPAWRGRVLNIHPALLPRHGGKGYYGDRVHQSVLEHGDRESGCTVHHCDDRYDTGAIVLQRRVPVLDGDTVETLATRVFEAECEAYPEAIARWAEQRAKSGGAEAP